MNEEEVIKVLNIASGKTKGVHIYQNTLIKAIETVLNLLEKKDKMIDLMANKIFEEGIVLESKEEVKQYYERKIENGN